MLKTRSSSLPTSQPISLNSPTGAESDLNVCISELHQTTNRIDSGSSSLITSSSNLFVQDPGIVNSFVQRLCEQRTKLLEFYNQQIASGHSTPKSCQFLDRIDQLFDEYLSTTVDNLARDDGPTNSKSVEDETYRSYFNDVDSLNDSNEVDMNELIVEQQTHSNVNHEQTTECSEAFNIREYDDHSYSKISRNGKVQNKRSTILELKRFKYNGCCPLTTRTYGLDPVKHGIRHFPCTRVTMPINLYKHLIQYHQLTHSPTMQIVRLLADENQEADVDLFSSQSNSLIATHPTVYRAQCPLNQYGKFGIIAEHKIRLCTQPNQPIGAPLVTPKDVCLYDHFVVYHQMKRSCAQRLAEAIVRKRNDAIFRPDEELLNETFYVQCPLREPKSICWKSPISTRHMGQHLTGIHKLDRTERRKIMAALRQQRSSIFISKDSL